MTMNRASKLVAAKQKPRQVRGFLLPAIQEKWGLDRFLGNDRFLQKNGNWTVFLQGNSIEGNAPPLSDYGHHMLDLIGRELSNLISTLTNMDRKLSIFDRTRAVGHETSLAIPMPEYESYRQECASLGCALGEWAPTPSRASFETPAIVR